MDQKVREGISRDVIVLLEEAFEKHYGIFTDEGTSFLETLAGIDAVRASRMLPGLKQTIAGHAYHARFFLDVLVRYMDGVRGEKIDWGTSWKTTTVTAEEWERIRSDLATEYESIKTRLSGVSDWFENDALGGALAILAHTAYHLGAIRQMMDIETG